MNSWELNDLAYWYPLIEGLVPTPKTRIIRTELDLLPMVDGVKVDGFKSFTFELVAAGDEVGWPCFLRTGHGSGKHDWKRTCFVPGPFDIPSHVRALVEWSEMVDFMGLPYANWVVRELLHTESAFVAFHGDMPITKERRYFAEGGKILGFHPYWPTDAFTMDDGGAFDGDLTQDAEWRDKLAVLNDMSADEVSELSALSERVSECVPGAWSIDWLWTTDRGWFLTDMAVAGESFCWREHPNAPQGDLGRSERQTVIDQAFHQEPVEKVQAV